ncbi:TOBE domain-containing protein [Nonomuraea thailandensis]
MGRGIRREPADQPAPLPRRGRSSGRGGRLDAAAPRWTTAEDGRPLLLGLRAEDLSVEQRGDASLSGELYGLEPLGDRTVVDVRVGTEILKVKARATVTGTPGERLLVTVDLDRAHLFDAGTGLALSEAGR